jgi:hypothetical protein
MQNNSTIIAVGMSIPMPSIINSLNTEEFRREQEEQEKKEPAFQNVKWGSTSVEEGEEIELTAGVKDIADGNMVTLQVFPEGKGPEDGYPYARFPLTVKDGSVSAKWKWLSDTGELPPDANPKFTFTAHSAWCNFEKSSNTLEVKLKRPEITKVEWQDADGNAVSKGLVGEILKLHAETKDMEGGITFHIYDVSTGKEVTGIGADIKGDKAEAEWVYYWNGEKLDEKPKFKVEVTGNRCKNASSAEIEISQKVRFYLTSTNGQRFNNVRFLDDNGNELKLGDGYYEKESEIPGEHRYTLIADYKNVSMGDYLDIDEGFKRIQMKYSQLCMDGIKIKDSVCHVVMLERSRGISRGDDKAVVVKSAE